MGAYVRMLYFVGYKPSRAEVCDTDHTSAGNGYASRCDPLPCVPNAAVVHILKEIVEDVQQLNASLPSAIGTRDNLWRQRSGVIRGSSR